MRQIPLTKGQVTLVDDNDYEDLIQYKWRTHICNHTLYAVRWLIPRKKIIAMHQQILGLLELGYESDHKDGNGLNNQRNNLRIATTSQNHMNQKKRSNCSSIYKGVTYDLSRDLWCASIGFNGVQRKLGRYTEEKSAAIAYNKKAYELYGEFARLNEV